MDPNLYEASRKGDVELLTKTLGSPDPPVLTRSLTPQNNNVLHIAVRFGQEVVVEKIIELCPSLVLQPNSKGDTPLHWAARAGHLLLTQILTDGRPTAPLPPPAGGDLEQGGSGVVPENSAEGSSGSNTRMVLKMRNCQGNTAIHEALKKSHEKVALFLLSLDGELACDVNGAGESPIYLAAEAGLNEVVSTILYGPATFSLAGPDGQTPLHIAVIRGRLETVRMLVKSMTEELVIRADNFGKTALHHAVTCKTPYQRAIFLKLLYKNPYAAYVSDKDHNSPLQLATKFGHKMQVGRLLDCRPDSAEIVDRTGRNVFHLAAMNGNVWMLKYLLKRPELKEMVNEADDDGNRPIHLAIQNNNCRVAWTLWRCKAVDCELTNNQGLTALDVLELNKEISYRQAFIRFLLRRKGRSGQNRGRFGWVTKMKPSTTVKPSERTNKILFGLKAALLGVVVKVIASWGKS